MAWRDEVALSVPPALALAFAKGVLARAGFEIIQADEQAVRAVGPHMNSTGELPLRGAGRVRVEVRDGALIAEADLAGLRRLTLLMIAAAPLLVLVIGLLQGALWLPSSAPTLLVFLALTPLISMWLRRRTRKALSAFLRLVASPPVDLGPDQTSP